MKVRHANINDHFCAGENQETFNAMMAQMVELYNSCPDASRIRFVQAIKDQFKGSAWVCFCLAQKATKSIIGTFCISGVPMNAIGGGWAVNSWTSSGILCAMSMGHNVKCADCQWDAID